MLNLLGNETPLARSSGRRKRSFRSAALARDASAHGGESVRALPAERHLVDGDVDVHAAVRTGSVASVWDVLESAHSRNSRRRRTLLPVVNVDAIHRASPAVPTIAIARAGSRTSQPGAWLVQRGNCVHGFRFRSGPLGTAANKRMRPAEWQGGTVTGSGVGFAYRLGRARTIPRPRGWWQPLTARYPAGRSFCGTGAVSFRP